MKTSFKNSHGLGVTKEKLDGILEISSIERRLPYNHFNGESLFLTDIKSGSMIDIHKESHSKRFWYSINKSGNFSKQASYKFKKIINKLIKDGWKLQY